jgi:hypothetical protein
MGSNPVGDASKIIDLDVVSSKLSDEWTMYGTRAPCSWGAAKKDASPFKHGSLVFCSRGLAERDGNADRIFNQQREL